MAVHPHARGEHIVTRNNRKVEAGSSQRTWGTHRRDAQTLAGFRFIPTHVGNTLRSAPRCHRPTVHPHARGEHEISERSRSSADGSSPRTWGTPCLRPALSCRPAVHPHARGEHWPWVTRRHTAAGSSPRTWGTRLTGRRGTSRVRFIPTHVGNTLSAPPSLPVPSVHPHARGEHGISLSILGLRVGSSPRTWGTLQSEGGAEGAFRFIPTHVGNT